jgi:uncharacterized protein YhaN
MTKDDIIKNADKNDLIVKSKAILLKTAEDLAQGNEKTLPSIRIVFSEEVEGRKGIDMTFDTEEKRDNVFEQISKDLDAKLFRG